MRPTRTQFVDPAMLCMPGEFGGRGVIAFKGVEIMYKKSYGLYTVYSKSLSAANKKILRGDFLNTLY